MYEVVRYRTESPITKLLEARLSDLYSVIESSSEDYARTVSLSAQHDNVVAPSVPQWQQIDNLRHFIAEHENGYLFDLKFSHCEFVFANALMQLNIMFGQKFLRDYPDLSELVVRQFRLVQGEGAASIEALPLAALEDYAKRWELPIWEVAQVFKSVYRPLQTEYQAMLKSWACESEVF
jgi:hypothetical protein